MVRHDQRDGLSARVTPVDVAILLGWIAILLGFLSVVAIWADNSVIRTLLIGPYGVLTAIWCCAWLLIGLRLDRIKRRFFKPPVPEND